LEAILIHIIEEEQMKKIIGVLFLGACLCAGTAFAGMPSDHEKGEPAGSGKGQGSGTHPLFTDDGGFFGSAAVDLFDAEDGHGSGTHPLLTGDRGFFGSAAADIFGKPIDGDDDFPGQGYHYGEQQHEAAVPVPGTVLLLGSGVAGMFFLRRNGMQKS
jgi:hypothetical protein